MPEESRSSVTQPTAPPPPVLGSGEPENLSPRRMESFGPGSHLLHADSLANPGLAQRSLTPPSPLTGTRQRQPLEDDLPQLHRSYGHNHFSRGPSSSPQQHSLHATRTRAGQKAHNIKVINKSWKGESGSEGKVFLKTTGKGLRQRFSSHCLFFLIKFFSKLGRIRSCHHPA